MKTAMAKIKLIFFVGKKELSVCQGSVITADAMRPNNKDKSGSAR